MTNHWQRSNPDTGGLIWLGLDHRGHSANLLSLEVLEEMESQLAAIEQQLAQAPDTALVIHSLKPKGFIAGADVGELDDLADPSAAGAHIRRVHGLFERIERLRCPTLALIHGWWACRTSPGHRSGPRCGEPMPCSSAGCAIRAGSAMPGTA